MSRRGWVVAAALGLGFGCGRAPLPRAQLEAKVERSSAALVPVGSSAPTRPGWVQAQVEPEADGIAVRGRGSGATEDQARQVALRDLYTNLSMFASVDVRYEASARDSEAGGEASERVETQTRSLLRGVATDARYWERFASPLAGTSGRFDYFVRARVPAAQVARLRAAARRRRADAGGRPTLVVLPPSITAEAARPLALNLQAELTAKLARGTWRVPDADQVRGVLEGVPPIEALRLDRVEEVFGPDAVLGGLVDVIDDRVAVTLVRYDLAQGAAQTITRLELPWAARAELGAVLLRLGTGHLSTRPPTGAPLAAASYDALTQAEAAFAEGRSLEALDAVQVAIRAEPSRAAFMRAGRILDRLGRYARPSPAPAVGRGAGLRPPQACSEASVAAQARARTAQAALERAVAAPVGPRWWDEQTPRIEAALRPVLAAVESWAACAPNDVRCVDRCVSPGGFCPDVDLDPKLEPGWRRLYGTKGRLRPEATVRRGPHASHAEVEGEGGGPVTLGRVGGLGHWLMVSGPRRGWVRRTEVRLPAEADPVSLEPPRASAHAYAAAFALADRAGDRRARAEATLALATVALRVRALGPARRLFSALEAEAERNGDLDLQSRAAFGRARALRALERRDEAQAVLQMALELRQRIGGQVELLELFTELGALALERGDDAGAADALGRARALAGRLGNAYLEVVVGNNLGVLALRRGARGPAHARFLRALDHLRDLGEAEGTLAASLNVAFTEDQAGEADVARGLRAQAWDLARTGGRWSWLAAVAAHRGASPGAPTSRALEDLHLAGALYARAGQAEALARVQDGLRVRELDEPAARRCVAEGYWADGAPIYEAPDGGPAEPLLSTVPPGLVAPSDVVAAVNAVAAYVLHEWSPTVGRRFLGRPPRSRVLQLRDPKRPKPPSRDRLQVVEEVVLLGAVDAVPGVALSGPPGTRARPPPKPIPYKKAARYDRILGSMTVSPTSYVALTPAGLEASLGGWRGARAARVTHAARQLEAAERHARQNVQAHLLAYVRLDRAALDWFRWRPEAAYAGIEAARARFAALEDARGLALTDEWLGYMMRQSDRPRLAARHLSRARALYARLGDDAGVARVLGYAD